MRVLALCLFIIIFADVMRIPPLRKLGNAVMSVKSVDGKEKDGFPTLTLSWKNEELRFGPYNETRTGVLKALI